jgi:membrane protease YdiL (CAAX protease family)
MEPAPISTRHLLSCLVAVILLEGVAMAVGTRTQFPRLWLIMAARTGQAIAVVGLTVIQTGGTKDLGLGRKAIWPGIRTGLLWSVGFAAVAGSLLLGAFMAGLNPLSWVRSPLPESASQCVLYFFVGGIVAPVAEEIFFRGLIFGYLRRWGVPTAVLISTALFALVHVRVAVPVTQIVGGIVFAVAYHKGRSLMVPMVIHMLGNLAIFTLSLIPY